jgi:hypothetical protein
VGCAPFLHFLGLASLGWTRTLLEVFLILPMTKVMWCMLLVKRVHRGSIPHFNFSCASCATLVIHNRIFMSLIAQSVEVSQNKLSLVQ